MSLNVQSDWDNRHFIANIQYNIMKVVAFLNDFGTPPDTQALGHSDEPPPHLPPLLLLLSRLLY